MLKQQHLLACQEEFLLFYVLKLNNYTEKIYSWSLQKVTSTSNNHQLRSWPTFYYFILLLLYYYWLLILFIYLFWIGYILYYI